MSIKEWVADLNGVNWKIIEVSFLQIVTVLTSLGVWSWIAMRGDKTPCPGLQASVCLVHDLHVDVLWAIFSLVAGISGIALAFFGWKRNTDIDYQNAKNQAPPASVVTNAENVAVTNAPSALSDSNETSSGAASAPRTTTDVESSALFDKFAEAAKQRNMRDYGDTTALQTFVAPTPIAVAAPPATTVVASAPTPARVPMD